MRYIHNNPINNAPANKIYKSFFPVIKKARHIPAKEAWDIPSPNKLSFFSIANVPMTALTIPNKVQPRVTILKV